MAKRELPEVTAHFDALSLYVRVGDALALYCTVCDTTVFVFERSPRYGDVVTMGEAHVMRGMGVPVK